MLKKNVKLKGLSLLLCIKDMIYGRVNKNDVVCIISGTCAKTEDDWTQIFKQYASLYWYDHVQQAEEIFRELIEKKIDSTA